MERNLAQRLCVCGFSSTDAWLLALAYQGNHAMRSTHDVQVLQAQLSGDFSQLLDIVVSVFSTLAEELGVR